ncbi:MAG TPA: two-component regulator propeller domain-containing protein, partial [Chitinophagaceae bacterium]|nr:two-component regulator propeller domain-containing protein [Chitinophagaceae bacterium]
MLRINHGNSFKSIFQLLIAGGFILLMHGAAQCQQKASYIFHRIKQSDGLLHTSVRSIVQDAKGFIWILTPNGLQRYDGSRFVNYPYDVTSPAGIIDTRTAGLFSDHKNNCLWIIDKEVEKLDLQTNQFSLFSRTELLKNDRFHFETYTDSLNNKWYLGDFGLLCDRPFEYMLPFYLSASSLAPKNGNVFFTDSLHDQTWMADFWQGLILFDKKTKKVYTHAYNPIHHPLLQLMDKTFLTAIMQDSKQNIWIHTNTPRFFRYDPGSGKLFTYSLKDIDPLNRANDHNTTLYVDNFFEDNHNNFWISTANAGLLQYNRKEDKFILIVDEE